MSTPTLVTKLYVPPPRPKVVSRPRLIKLLNDGLHRRLTLVSAPAGFGKTTLVSEWVAGCERPVAWLSLDEADHDTARFLTYLIAALQTVAANVGIGVVDALHSPQPPATESILTLLLNEIAALPDDIVLVLDDFHVVDAKPVDQALTFLLENLPPRLHLVITTREDPQLPLARLRARGQMTELRAAHLRFTPSEAADFLNAAMGLDLSVADITALEERTEGWIAGLQLAAISMRGLQDATGFIQSFTGSHHFVMDYLVEEVLQRQSESVQSFLLRTSILDRLCGPLCDAVLLDATAPGQETLESIERANLFLVPLDDERRWYRYHHLFAELLRQRLRQGSATVPDGVVTDVTDLHSRASQWYEDHGLETDAFHHAAAANDVARSEHLIRGKGTPLYVRGGLAPVLTWLESLPAPVLDASPSLSVMFATTLSIAGQMTRVEPRLQIAEAALESVVPDDETRDLVGRIAGLRALLAVLAADPRQLDTIIVQSHRALEYLHPDNLRERAPTLWKLGLALQHQGDRAAAHRAYTEAISTSEKSGNVHVNILATTSLGITQELANQLPLATDTYRRVLRLVGDPPGPVACEAHVGLARIHYEWNELDVAHEHGHLSVHLARQIEIASFVSSELFLARLQLAQGDVAGAIASLTRTEQAARQRNFWFRLPEVAAAQVRALLHQGNVAEAAHLAQSHELPLSQARVHLAQGDPSTALTVLELWRRQVEAKGWEDERLKVMVLQALAHHAHGEKDTAVRLLDDALMLARPGGFIRLFVDEGLPMAQLLSEAAAHGVMPDYTGKLLAVFEAEKQKREDLPCPLAAQPLAVPLSPRELEVLRLIAQGLSNREICARLFLALDTVKGHNRKIFGKLDVQSRTEAMARARELDLL